MAVRTENGEQKIAFNRMTLWGSAALLSTGLICVEPLMAIPAVGSYIMFVRSFRRNSELEAKSSFRQTVIPHS